MAKVTINDKVVEVPDGINVVEAAKIAGVEIPHYCYHPGLSIAGNCRMCLVEIEGMPGRGLPIACNTFVKDGMVVKTETETVKKARAGVMEFLLINHPVDCPICDKAGECRLQDYSYEHGNAHNRMIEPREIMPKKDVSDRIVLFADRCIMCTRCVRFCQEVTGTHELGVFNRGDRNEIDVFPGQPVDNPLAGNVVDICPVGALKSKKFLYQARVWELKKTPTTCPLCSAGCEIWADTQKNQLKRIRGRSTDTERGPWICDIGRLGLDFVNSADRLKEPQVRNEDGEQVTATWDEAFDAIRRRFREIAVAKNAKAIGGLISTWRTNEEGAAFKTFFEETIGSPYYGYLRGDTQPEQKFPGGFIIESDMSPNTTGLKALLPETTSVVSAIERGLVLGLYLAAADRPGPLPADLLAALDRLQFLVVEAILPSPLTERADVVLPGVSFLEKRGTFQNSRGQERRFRNAMAAPPHARDAQRILHELARRLRAKEDILVGAEGKTGS